MSFDVDFNLTGFEPTVTADPTFGVSLHAWSENGAVTLRFDSAEEAERLLDEWLHKTVQSKQPRLLDDVPARKPRVVNLMEALEESVRQAKARRGAV